VGITDRLRFIARSYLNAAKKRGSRVLDQDDTEPLTVGSLSDDELEAEIRRKVEAELDAEATDEPRPRRKRPRPGAGPSAQRPSNKRKLAQCYANLELAPGAPLEEIHKAWRRLILKYHPDRFPGDATKMERATRITQIINESYNTLLEHLGETKTK